jgi:two-component system, NtrC family, sensor kinase
MHSMHATLLGLPESVSNELEQAFQAEGLALECRRLAPGNPSLPQVFPPGLVLLWESGGTLEFAVSTCRQLASICALSRSWLFVLTRRDVTEQSELILAGARECISPSGERWAPNLLTHVRHLGIPSREGDSPAGTGTSRVPPERALQTLLAATTADLGHDFFRTLVKRLAEAFRVTCAMVGEMRPEQDSIQTLAFWSRGAFQNTVTYPLSGTPCHNAVVYSICHYADDVSRHFPEDLMLTDLGLRGYLGAALRSAQGEVIGVLAILHDQLLDAGELDFSLLGAFATRAGAELERVRAQVELERTRDFLRNTLEAVPDPIFVKDRNHRVQAVNSALCRLVGRTARELVGQHSSDVFPEYQAQESWAQDEQSFASGLPGESEQSFTDNTGMTRTILTRRAVFPGADGQPSLVSVIRDLTERKRLETQLRLADRMTSMGTLAAGVAHEINNPLSYVSANLTYLGEQLSGDTLPPEVLPELREVLVETQEGAARVRSIVQDLKSFARGDEESQGPIDIHQVIESAVRLVRNELQRYNAQLERLLEPVPPVLGNASRLGQVLVNLLVNAMQAFPEQRPESNRIRISTRLEAPRRVVVEVEDNGQGMSQEVLQRIFDPFFTTKPVGVGTGLGLAICHTIVQSMGGQIDVRSMPGRGTTFVLALLVVEQEGKARSETGSASLAGESKPQRPYAVG